MITRDLLDRFRAGHCTPDEVATLRAYFDQPDTPTLDDLLAQDWQYADATTPLPNGASGRLWQRLYVSVQGSDEVPVRPLNSRRWVGWQWVVAASVAGLLMVGGWLVWQRKTLPEPMTDGANNSMSDGWRIKTNETNAPLNLTLSDGSTVRLLPGSRVRYPVRFASALRTVQLSGEAFFAVQPDKAHPFVVQTRSVLVRVLGTSFTVRDFASQPTAEVAVKTGRVSVSPTTGKTDRTGAPERQPGLVLAPNERATLTVANGQVVKALVVAPEVVNPKAVVNRFVFADTPVAAVFGELERAYGVTIQHDRQMLVNCTITARLSEQPLFTKLDMICASIGATYRIDGTTVVVQSAGCE